MEILMGWQESLIVNTEEKEFSSFTQRVSQFYVRNLNSEVKFPIQT